MPSQIQVTCWREDHPGQTTGYAVSSKQRSGSKGNNSNNQAVTKTETNKSKGDGSIAERIVTAARAAKKN